MNKKEWSSWYEKRNKDSDIKNIVKSEVSKTFKSPVGLDKNHLKNIEKESKSWWNKLLDRCTKSIILAGGIALSQTLSAQSPEQLEEFSKKDTIEVIYNGSVDTVIEQFAIQKEYWTNRLLFDIQRKNGEIGDKIRFISYKDQEYNDIYNIDVEIDKVM